MREILHFLRRLAASLLVALAVGGCGTVSPTPAAKPVAYVTPDILKGRWDGTFTASDIMWLSAVPSQHKAWMTVWGPDIRWHQQGSRGRWFASSWSDFLIDGTAYINIRINWSDIQNTIETIPVRITEDADAYFMTGHFDIGGPDNLNADFVLRKPKSRPKTATACIDQARVSRDVKVAKPAPDVPKDYARFLGLWSNGKWGGVLCNSLLVSSIDAAGNAHVIYAWGASDDWHMDEPGTVETEAKVLDNKLRLKPFKNGAKVTYWFSGGILKGRYRSRNGTSSFVELQKIEEPEGLARQDSSPSRAKPVEHVTKEMLDGNWSGTTNQLSASNAASVPVEFEVKSSVVTWRAGPTTKSHHGFSYIVVENGVVRYFVNGSWKTVTVLDVGDKYVMRWYSNEGKNETIVSRPKTSAETGRPLGGGHEKQS